MDNPLAVAAAETMVIDPVELECDELQLKQAQLSSLPVLNDEVKKKIEHDLTKIERRYNALYNANPRHGRVIFGLALQYINTDRASAAILYSLEAIRVGYDKAAVWLNLATAYKIEHRDEDAENAYKEALKRIEGGDTTGNPCVALAGIGSLYVNRGEPQKVIDWSEKALIFDPQDRFALWNKGLGHLEKGEWEEGFRLYDEIGFRDGGFRPKERKERTYARVLKRWEGEKGLSVVCYGEQGIGDEVMFFSVLPDLIRDCRSVVVECDGRILDLMKHSFPGVQIYPRADATAPFDWLCDHPEITHWVPCGSLGKYYRKKADDFPRTPYLTPEPYLVKRWGEACEKIGTRNLRVALSWRGGLKKTRQDKRSMGLKQWAPILQTPGVDFYSLQYHHDAADECASVGRELGVPIHHWNDVVDSYDRTAGFLANMDLVITVNTSLVHLAGAIGTPTLCMTPVYCAWRYGTKGRNPFYGSVEMLRQRTDGDWKPVIERARERVAGLAVRKEREAA